MGGEKGGSKAGGFFNLFDWNRKSKKKLFSNGTVSPEGEKQGKKSDDTLPSTRLHLIEEDEMFGIPSLRGSSDYSCASSVTDEEGYGSRAPGVVARLMGLDSMPSSSVSDPYSTPFFDSRSLRDNYSQKRSPDIHTNDKLDHVPIRADSYFRKPMNPRPQKMPSSPIERFQTEALPPRSAKALPMTYHKLLSPTKNLTFVSAKNAAEIMEAAAKFIEPGLHTPSSLKDKSSFGTSRIPLKVRDPKEIRGIQQRTSRLLQLSRTADLHDIQFSGGQPLNKNWRSTEDIVIFRPSPEPYCCNSAETRTKSKSISLAVQAKVNVQRREGLVTSKSNMLVQNDHECKINQPFRSQSSIPKNKYQKKPSSGNLSGVLRQNNQKQNCSSTKGKLGLKQSMSNQHGRKGLSGDASSMKQKPGNLKVGSRKQVLQTSGLEREGSSSSNKDFPQKKRLTEGGFNTMKSTLIKNVPVIRHDTQVQRASIDEHKRWAKNNNKSDIVSFTFTSPLIKSVTGMPATNEMVDNLDKGNNYNFDCSHQKVSPDIDQKVPSHGLDVLSGDALSHLLERKLRELTSVMEPSRNFIKGGNFGTSESCYPVQLDSKTSPDSLQFMRAEHVFSVAPCEDTPNCTSSPGISSINGQMHGVTTMLKVYEEAEHSIISDAHMESNHKQPSLHSMLEASFSNESWQSSESSGSTNGYNSCTSSAQTQNVMSLASSKETASVEIDFQLSDSASSKLMDTSVSSESSMTHIRDTCQMKSNTEDIKYVREILHNRGLTYSKCLSSYYLICGKGDSDSLNFEHSVCITNKDAQELEDQGNKGRRRMLFDCVQECLDLKCNLYFRAGYEAWAKGMALTRTDLAEEFCQEISVWKSMKDLTVDDLVDNDMSTNLGKWVDFRVEEFETGKEIQEEILGYLLDEVLADFRVKNKG